MDIPDRTSDYSTSAGFSITSSLSSTYTYTLGTDFVTPVNSADPNPLGEGAMGTNDPVTSITANMGLVTDYSCTAWGKSPPTTTINYNLPGATTTATYSINEFYKYTLLSDCTTDATMTYAVSATASTLPSTGCISFNTVTKKVEIVSGAGATACGVSQTGTYTLYIKMTQATYLSAGSNDMTITINLYADCSAITFPSGISAKTYTFNSGAYTFGFDSTTYSTSKVKNCVFVASQQTSSFLPTFVTFDSTTQMFTVNTSDSNDIGNYDLVLVMSRTSGSPLS